MHVEHPDNQDFSPPGPAGPYDGRAFDSASWDVDTFPIPLRPAERIGGCLCVAIGLAVVAVAVWFYVTSW